MKISELFEDSPGKKVLLSGNEAFARGIFEAGVRFAANYPGTPLSEVGDYLNYLSQILEDFTFDYSVNEKVALESCVGASWTGVRSVVMFKHMGLNVAADPLHTFPYSGVNGGMLILCGGDPSIFSSTNAQDNRLYSLHTKIPIIEPATVQECKDFIKDGLRFSELYKVPVYVHVTARICHSSGVVTLGEIQKRSTIGHFKKDPDRYINTLQRALANQKKYFNIVAQIAKDRKLFHLFNKIKIIEEDIVDREPQNEGIGVLTSGACYGYVIQACHKLQINPPILKLGLVFPINRQEICEIANELNLKKLLVVEELEPFLETFSKRVFCNFCDAKRDLEIQGKDFLPNTGELNTDLVMNFFSKQFKIKYTLLLEKIQQKENALKEILPSLPIREPTFCPGCQYRPVFYALKKVVDEISEKEQTQYIFAQDIGCYTLAEAYPYNMADWVICMGAGIGIANGMAQVLDPKKERLIAFIGDSTFFHTGIQPLLNAMKNDLDITVIIFNNYWTAMTGHQPHMATPREFLKPNGRKSKIDAKGINLINFVESLGLEHLIVTEAYNIEKLERIFKDTLNKEGLKAIIIKEECALEKNRRLKSEFKAKSPENRVRTYYQISESCVKCNECIEFLGCPAINASYEKETNSSEKKAPTKQNILYYIDDALCMPNICPGVCKSVCKNNMIKKTIINPHLE